RIDGIAMERGDGQRPSHLLKLLDNLYRWLAEPGIAQGFGGYERTNANAIHMPTYDADALNKAAQDDSVVAGSWASPESDPLVTGPVRPMKILVGARSDLSDGQGSVAQWAAAARAAGYDVVCFTERLEHIDHARWDDYVASCHEHSGP